MKKAKVVSRKAVFRTPWFRLLAKTVSGEAGRPPHYALEANDYVTVFALTPDRRVLLVRQFRPAVEKYTVELPSGHVEKGQTPAEAARTELVEETGHRAARLELVGSFKTDVGRMTNRTWCFYAEGARPVPGFRPDPGLRREAWPVKKLLARIADGSFDHAIIIAAIYLVVLKKGIRA